MADEDWYQLADNGSLLQGNILMNCPVFSVSRPLDWPLSADAELEIEAKVFASTWPKHSPGTSCELACPMMPETSNRKEPFSPLATTESRLVEEQAYYQ